MTPDKRGWQVIVPFEDAPGRYRTTSTTAMPTPDSACSLASQYPGAVVVRDGAVVKMLRLLQAWRDQVPEEQQREIDELLDDALPERYEGGRQTRSDHLDIQALPLLNLAEGLAQRDAELAVALVERPRDHRLVYQAVRQLLDQHIAGREDILPQQATLLLCCAAWKGGIGRHPHNAWLDHYRTVDQMFSGLAENEERAKVLRQLCIDAPVVRSAFAELVYAAGLAASVEEAERLLNP